MRSRFGRLCSCALILLALTTVGCAHRYYDSYHNDYHRWDHQEQVYYNQWTVENHIDPHRDYNHLSKDEQKRYWDWRHEHDHDHH
jgi:hypothetical protein